MLHDVNFQYNTLVGERGVLLFGGQRIAIARALYKKVDVIIFDEATSALDNETEKAVISSIDSLGDELTVLIVAHRLTTLQNCDKIFEIGGGRVFYVKVLITNWLQYNYLFWKYH